MAKSSKKGFFKRIIERTENSLEAFSGMFDEYITVGDVLDALEEVSLDVETVSTLATAEKLVVQQLKTSFEIVKSKYQVDETLKLKIAAEVEGQIGIVVTMAKDINNTKLFTLLGKLFFLSKQVYNDKLILLVVGGKATRRSSAYKDLKALVSKIDVVCHYTVLE